VVMPKLLSLRYGEERAIPSIAAGLDPVPVRVAEGLDDRVPLERLHPGELTSGRVVTVTG
jgi:hypothetical protein